MSEITNMLMELLFGRGESVLLNGDDEALLPPPVAKIHDREKFDLGFHVAECGGRNAATEWQLTRLNKSQSAVKVAQRRQLGLIRIIVFVLLLNYLGLKPETLFNVLGF